MKIKTARYCFTYLPPLIRIGMYGCIVILFSLSGSARMQHDTIVFETAHMPILHPHQHDAGDAAGDPAHHAYIMSPIFMAEKDAWISEISFDIHNAPDTIVHHASLLNHSEPHQTCANLPFSQMYIMAQDSMHVPTMTFPSGTGMRIKKGQLVQLSIMIHNPFPPVGPGEAYYNVYGTLKLNLRPDNESAQTKAIRPYLLHLDEEPCVIRTMDQTDAYVFTVPPKTHDYTFTGSGLSSDPATYAFQKPSAIVYLGAHVHGWQGGKKVLVYKNDEPFLTFETKLSDTYPYRYDTPYYPASLEMQSGDTLTLRAVYDNPNDVMTRGAMGDLQIYFYEQ